MADMFTDNDFNIPESMKYDQFLQEVYSYINKEGLENARKRTVRKQIIQDFYEFKDEFKKREAYLVHRYECMNDNFIWQQILDRSELGYIFHLDFSENVGCTPKFKPHDTHFSGKKTSLHCNVVYAPGAPKPIYAYHFSDDKNHDSVYVDFVV